MDFPPPKNVTVERSGAQGFFFGNSTDWVGKRPFGRLPEKKPRVVSFRNAKDFLYMEHL